MKKHEKIVTEIYKRSITHIEGYETVRLSKTSMLCLSEVLEAMAESNKDLLKWMRENNITSVAGNRGDYWTMSLPECDAPQITSDEDVIKRYLNDGKKSIYEGHDPLITDPDHM